MAPIETFEHEGLTVEIDYDSDPQNPREDTQVASLVCWHKRYVLGDEQPKVGAPEWGLEKAREFVPDLLDLDTPEDQEAVNRILNDKLEIVGLYLYDHSGITMSTAPFSCPWDSGQVGFAYVTLNALAECDMLDPKPTAWTPELRARAREIIKQEVEEYDAFLRGEVYGYVVKKTKTCDLGHRHDEVIDSCCGFIGELDYCKSEAKAAASAHKD